MPHVALILIFLHNFSILSNIDNLLQCAEPGPEFVDRTLNPARLRRARPRGLSPKRGIERPATSAL